LSTRLAGPAASGAAPVSGVGPLRSPHHDLHWWLEILALLVTFAAATVMLSHDSATPYANAPAAQAPDLFGSVALSVAEPADGARLHRALSEGLPSGPGPWVDLVARARTMPMARRLSAVNAFVNHALAYATDQQVYGQQKHWAGARESLPRGRADCVGYALAKLQLLQAAGTPLRDLYFVVVNDLVRREQHAVTAVLVDGRFFILDSGTDEVLPAEDVHDYRPILTYGAGHVWIHGYRLIAPTRVASTAPASAPASP